jgi:hypothetical protein
MAGRASARGCTTSGRKLVIATWLTMGLAKFLTRRLAKGRMLLVSGLVLRVLARGHPLLLPRPSGLRLGLGLVQIHPHKVASGREDEKGLATQSNRGLETRRAADKLAIFIVGEEVDHMADVLGDRRSGRSRRLGILLV